MFNYITADPAILGGKPCIKGTRISVEFILELFASGATREDILQAYPHLTDEGIEEALHYAAHFLKNEMAGARQTLRLRPRHVRRRKGRHESRDRDNGSITTDPAGLRRPAGSFWCATLLDEGRPFQKRPSFCIMPL